ncbi:MAG: carboxylesterase family protein [Dysgonamonadaceae bacterium]|nr:carboxylesterase family protein [Dysgonamonadaceae bacterium]MDD3900699.1 carboxylesterase family protein [Dysgonamonadaceae bacterium]
MKTNRRNFFQTMGAGAAGFGLATTLPLASCAASTSSLEVDDDQVLFIGDDIAIADTVYGKVKGFILRGITQFRGIPYGADTSGNNRFMPPQKPKPWNDVFPAVWWGNTAPQIMDNRYANSYSSFADHWNYDDVSEDCLKLNVWTPAIDRNKRPVLVWLHGGGFTNGNGIEQDGYMGENLSRKGNVVFVSINHRLGPIGFSDLSGVGGEKYKHSGNVGALDMVAALEWVKENVSNFGGDPNNVTIMGQSGGGSKVCTVAAMPAAAGLIHKAVPLSGSTTSAMDQDVSRKLGEYILKEAGLKASEIDKLQEMPWKEYISLANRASRNFAQENGNTGMRIGFAPVADGINIPKGIFYSEENGISSTVPMIICSTFHEWGTSRTNPELEKITAEEAKEMMKSGTGLRRGGLGDKAPVVYDAYAKAFPDATPYEVLSLISSNRQGVVNTATAKINQPAPVYVAWFGWEPPLFDGRMRAFHCSDICFWFYNTDLMLTHTGGGARPRKLSEKMSDALLSFMETGDPNCNTIPTWPKFTAENGEVMILNDICEVKNDPDKQGREML